MPVTLFEKYGGFASISRLIMTFYEKILESEEVGPFFDETEMGVLIDHQTKFVASLLGGPASIGDERLKQAHARFDIRPEHFNAVRDILADSLAEHDFAPDDIAHVIAAVEARRSLIEGAP